MFIDPIREYCEGYQAKTIQARNIALGWCFQAILQAGKKELQFTMSAERCLTKYCQQSSAKPDNKILAWQNFNLE